ncbi:MAG: phosphate signaling complex protein PhoU [Endomicrobia bacterium]|nr:phosphate signaling complex protein PhoU [Endomicrobiia bacterium]MCL2506100.1 phosphate signaling complex protein PhoU [Endomicrobiia bacterium]
MFQEKVLFLKKGIIEYAEHVEKMVAKSIEGTINRNEYLLHEVIDKDEAVANKYEVDFDEICVNYIAQYQPVAKNLRTIISAIKMSNDLERMADHATNISQNGLFIISHPFIKPFIDTPKMSKLTLNMLKESIRAFVNEDVCLAKEVLKKDDEIDSFKLRITEELTEFMQKDSKTVTRALRLMNIASNLERIADLATNICEDTIYLSDGEVIKHRKLQEVQ